MFLRPAAAGALRWTLLAGTYTFFAISEPHTRISVTSSLHPLACALPSVLPVNFHLPAHTPRT